MAVNEYAKKLTLEWGASSKTRTLVAINHRKNLESSLIYLERSGYELAIVHDMPSLIKSLSIHRPHAVLLSWNLKNTDVRRLYKILTEKFQLVCIVFAEDSQPRTNASLMGSGISHCLLSPVGGGTAHSRIQALIARKKIRKKKMANLQSAEAPLNDARPEDVPKDLRWEKTSTPATYGEILWRGISSRSTGSSKAYFFKGPDAPTYDSKKNDWTNITKGQFYSAENLEEARSRKVKLQSEKKLSPLDTSFDWETALKEAEIDLLTADDDLSPVLKENSDVVLPKEQTFATCLRRAVEFHPRVSYPPVHELANLSRMTVCGLKTEDHCGYLICVNSKNLFLTDYISSLIDQVALELNKIGESLNLSPTVLEIEVNELPFLPWAGSRADFSLVSEENGLAFAFFSTEELPQILISDNESLIGIKVENDLLPNTNLPFDLYLHLPQNKKYLLYIFKDRPLPEATYEKFMTFGMQVVYIKKSDKENFLGYCAKNFIEASI